jgi:SAM-dependent methyltransferase
MVERSSCADDAHDWSPWIPRTAESQATARICYRCGKYQRDDADGPVPALPPEGMATHREFVGPVERYDVNAAMMFNLLTTLGLRGGHKLLDIGCGSLRNGRLLIPYLEAGNYVGFEPNRWLVEEAIRTEIGADIVRLKKSRFFYSTSPDDLDPTLRFDYAFANAIFVHGPLSLFQSWITKTSQCLNDNGVFLASFHVGDEDHKGDSWLYPGHTQFRLDTIRAAAVKAGFRFQTLSWRHPHGYAWGLFAKPAFDTSWFSDETLSWNTRVDADRSYRIWPDGQPWLDAKMGLALSRTSPG